MIINLKEDLVIKQEDKRVILEKGDKINIVNKLNEEYTAVSSFINSRQRKYIELVSYDSPNNTQCEIVYTKAMYTLRGKVLLIANDKGFNTIEIDLSKVADFDNVGDYLSMTFRNGSYITLKD